MGVFARIVTRLAAEMPASTTISIDAAGLEARRTAAGLRAENGRAAA